MSSNGWKEYKFSEILSTPLKNGVNKPTKVRGDGYKMVNMGELFANSIIRNMEMARVPMTDSELKNSLLQPEDLLFARQSLTIEGAGKCSLFIGDDEPYTFEGHLIRARVNREIAFPRYIYYYFNSFVGKSKIETLVHVTAAAGIRSSDLSNLKIELPPFPAQRRIADILSTLDEKIELNRQTNDTLEAIAQAIFKEWFLENENITEWNVAPLSEIISLNFPRQLKKDTVAPYLDMANMPTKGHRAIEWRDRPFGSGTKFMNGDTLLARITPCLENGKTAFVDFLEDGQVGWGSTEYIVFTPKPPLPPEYGYYLARTEEVRNHAIQNMIGTSGRQRASASCFDSFMISVPPAKLAGRFGEIARSLMAEIKANDEEARILASIHDALLPKLMNGEIEV